VAPSLNWIVPLAELGETVAVKVTLCPKVDGLSDGLNETLAGTDTV
jgi:hypothetical protein